MLQGTNLATEDDPEPPGSGGQAYTVYEQVVGIFNKEKALEGSFSKYTIRSIVCKASCHPVTQSFGHLVI